MSTVTVEQKTVLVEIEGEPPRVVTVNEIKNITVEAANYGKPGEPGYTPQKGVDYFDGYTPQKNIDYFDGAPGYTPQKGIDYTDGAPGRAATVQVGTVKTGPVPKVENAGSATDAVLNFELQKGDKGNAGTIAVGTVTKGVNPVVENVGTPESAVFNFTLPQGDKGDPGSSEWGSITGNIKTQTDLIDEINNSAIAMAIALG